MSAETWTPIVVVVPERIAAELTRVTSETFRSAPDEDRLRIENVWPVRDVETGHFGSYLDAESFLSSLPDEFVLYAGHGVELQSIAKSRLSIEPHGYPSSVSDCDRCGWGRKEHASSEDAT